MVLNFKSDKLYELIFFVTSRCNSHCSDCFNRGNLNNQAEDLPLEKIDELSKNLPEIENLLLSGGEPFLRNDLPELINIFKVNNNIKTVSIPTNGLLTEKIIETCRKVLTIAGLTSFNINLSLDGLALTHDRIRGVEGNFEKTINTLRKLSELGESGGCLNILINSVVNKNNHRELFALHDYLAKEPVIANHFFEIIRPALWRSDTGGRKDFSPSKSFYRKILFFQYNKFKADLKSKNHIKNFLHQILFLGKFSLIYEIQRSNFKNNRAWPMTCRAGWNILVLNSDGRVRPCELRDKVFSLNENFKNKKIINNSELSRELELIKKQKCFCTHICFIDSSIKDSLYGQYFLIPFFGILNYIRYEFINYNPDL